jgi:calcineurin-like phosphoesterase family protein
MIFFTSDSHFGDPRVLRIDRRPFASIPEHDAALVAAWAQTVGPDDEVWHLGDFCRGDPATVDALLAALPGRKHLIIGNNDGPATLVGAGWASVQHYAELQLEGELLILCHYPFRTWNKQGKRSINLHGHSHGKLAPVTRQFDVGVDAQGWAPVPLQTVLASRKTRRPGAHSP